MVDLNALNAILSARNGVWTLVMLALVGLWRGWAGLPAVMAQWIARRQAIAAEKDMEFKRLREQVTGHAAELREVRENEKECQSQLRDALGRLAQVEGYMMGQGKAKQEAANIVAIERLIDRSADKDGGGK